METFKCKNCNQEKDRTHFSINRGTRSKNCKECNKLYMINHRKTKIGLLAQIYGDQVKNSKKRGMPPPAYTLKEFQAFSMSNNQFNTLYKIWEESDYVSGFNPSCDRLNDYLPYTFDNIQYISWRENNTKIHKDTKEGKYIKRTDRAIIQFDLEGNLVKEWIKIAEAERSFKIRLTYALNGERNTAGGYSWKYLDNYLLELLNDIENTSHTSKEKIHHSHIHFNEDTCLVSIQ